MVDLHALGGELIAVLDEGNRRVSFVSSDGVHAADVRTNADASKILRIGPPNLADLLNLRDWELQRVGDGRSGESPMWAPRPSEELLLAEAVVPATGAQFEVVAFRWSSTVAIRRNGIVSTFLAIDSVATPEVVVRGITGTTMRVKRVDPAARETTWAVGANGNCIVLLGPHPSESARSVMDFYAVDDFRYLGSIWVAGEASQLVVTNGHIGLLTLDPEPSVVTYAPPSWC